MGRQEFTDRDIDEIMADPSVTILSGWTEGNTDSPCDEAEYRRKLANNHEGYSIKLLEAVDSIADATRTAG